MTLEQRGHGAGRQKETALAITHARMEVSVTQRPEVVVRRSLVLVLMDILVSNASTRTWVLVRLCRVSIARRVLTMAAVGFHALARPALKETHVL